MSTLKGRATERPIKLFFLYMLHFNMNIVLKEILEADFENTRNKNKKNWSKEIEYSYK